MKTQDSGFCEINLILCIAVMLVAFAAGTFLGSNIVRDYRTDAIIRECTIIDRALTTYSATHKGIQAGTVTLTGKHYTGDNTYPSSLAELGVIRDEAALFSKEIDLSRYTYEVVTDPETHLTTYKLGVHLPNGYYYFSPNSYQDRD